MREFFKGWKRKAGCVSLLMTCVLVGGWVRSFETCELLCVPAGQTQSHLFGSNNSALIWATRGDASYLHVFYSSYVAEPDPLKDLRSQWRWDMREFHFGEATDEENVSTVYWIVPYWSVVLPLTLLSAYLLLSKPRPAKRPDSI